MFSTLDTLTYRSREARREGFSEIDTVYYHLTGASDHVRCSKFGTRSFSAWSTIDQRQGLLYMRDDSEISIGCATSEECTELQSRISISL